MDIQIFNQNNLISISQVGVSNSGLYSDNFTAGGPQWENGEITIKANYGGDSRETTVNLSGVSNSSNCNYELAIPGRGTVDVPLCGTDDLQSEIGSVFDSSLVMSGSSYTTPSFDTPGLFPYFCMVHPWMEGMIIVEDEGGSLNNIETIPFLTPAFADHKKNVTVHSN